MHFSTLVFIPKEGDPRTEVERLMAPHRERWIEDVNHEDGGRIRGHWDWYQIGGRWTGALTDYKPSEDPANLEKCDLCAGTGKRTDMKKDFSWCGGCNGCEGKGIRLKWPTDWKEFDGDVADAAYAATTDFVPHTYITPDGNWHSEETWNGESFDKNGKHDDEFRAALKAHDGRVVVVDYHS